MFSNNYTPYDLNEGVDFFPQREEMSMDQPMPNFFRNAPIHYKPSERPIFGNIFAETSPIRVKENFYQEDLAFSPAYAKCSSCQKIDCSCEKNKNVTFFDNSFNCFQPDLAPIAECGMPTLTLKKEKQDGCSDQNCHNKQTLESESDKNTVDDKEIIKLPPLNLPVKKAKSKNDSNLFLVRRACFRGFSEYFKNKFSSTNYSWQRKRGNKKKKTPILTLIRQFAEEEFGSVVKEFTEEQWVKFRTELITVMFSHRYKKNDDFLQGINFSKVRNVLYHYTTESRSEFMKNSYF